jgi:hypothetical protein
MLEAILVIATFGLFGAIFAKVTSDMRDKIGMQDALISSLIKDQSQMLYRLDILRNHIESHKARISNLEDHDLVKLTKNRALGLKKGFKGKIPWIG